MSMLNDIDGELINPYLVVKRHLEEFVHQFKWALVSRQFYGWFKKTPEETPTNIQRTGHEELAKSVKGWMIVWANDIPGMRQAFFRLRIERLEITAR